MKIKDSVISKLKDNYFRNRYFNIILIYFVLLFLVITVGIFDKKFLTLNNLRNLMIASFPLLMVSFAQAMIIMTRGIDLSLGSIVALTNVVCVLLMNPDSPTGFIIPIIVALSVGAICGLINGLFVTKGRISPIIVTLATTAIFSGVSLMLMNEPGGRVHRSFASFLMGDIFFIPVALIVFVLIFVLLRTITSFTPFGKAIKAIGGSESIAYSLGINIEKKKILVYVMGGILAAIAGIFLSAQMYSADPRLGAQYPNNAITASVLGGVSLSGAVGDLIGTVAGVFIISITNNMLNLLGVPTYYQYLFQGLILIIVLALPGVKDIRTFYKKNNKR